MFDDIPNIVANRNITLSQPGLEALYSAAFQSPIPTRPFAYVSFAVQYWLFGLDPAAWRILNTLVHCCACMAIFWLLRLALVTSNGSRRGESSVQFLACLGTLIWGLHPVHVQAVAYIVQRMTSLAACTYLWGLLCFSKACLSQRHRHSWAVAAILLYGLSLSTKEIGLTFPLACYLWERFFIRGKVIPSNSARFVYVASFFPMVAAAIWYLWKGPELADRMDFALKGHRPFRPYSLVQQLLTQPRVLVFYVSLLLFPHADRLSFLHEFEASQRLMVPFSTLLAILGHMLALLGIFLIRRRESSLLFGSLWFYLHLALEQSVLNLGLVFEHRLYLPSVGILVGAIVFVSRRANKPVKATVAFIAVLLFVAVWQALKIHKDEQTIYQHVVKVYPESSRAWEGWCVSLVKAKQMTKAEQACRKALELDPLNASTLGNLMNIHFELGRNRTAREHANNLIRLYSRVAEEGKPTHRSHLVTRRDLAWAHFTLGNIALDGDRFGEAEGQFKLSTEADPEFLPAWLNLGNLYEQSGKDGQAHDAYRSALAQVTDESRHMRFDPKLYAELHFRVGVLLEKRGEAKGALGHYRAALRFDPLHVGARLKLEDLADVP